MRSPLNLHSLKSAWIEALKKSVCMCTSSCWKGVRILETPPSSFLAIWTIAQFTTLGMGRDIHYPVLKMFQHQQSKKLASSSKGLIPSSRAVKPSLLSKTCAFHLHLFECFWIPSDSFEFLRILSNSFGFFWIPSDSFA